MTIPYKDKPATQGDIDNVVAVILKGFEKLATKDDLKSLATKDDMGRLEKRVENIESTLDEVKYDVRDIKRRVKNLEGDTASVTQVVDHEHRIKKLETRIFASS